MNESHSWRRTHTCGQLTVKDVGKTVFLMVGFITGVITAALFLLICGIDMESLRLF